ESLLMLAMVADHRQKTAEQRSLAEQSLALFRELGDRGETARVLEILGHAAKDEGDYAAARAFYEERIAVHDDLGDRRGTGWALADSRDSQYNYHRIYAVEAMAGLAAAEGQPERAARLFGAAEALREVAASPLPVSERGDHHRIVASVQASMDEEAFTAAWTA